MKHATLFTALLAMLLIVSFAPAQAKKHSTKKPTTLYVETGKMKLKPGVTDEQFIAIERNIRKGIINKQPGFVSREFGKDTEGYWYFILKWTSKEAGDAWTPVFQSDPNGQALMNALDFTTVRQEHFTVIKP
jgi:hypothetical protein